MPRTASRALTPCCPWGSRATATRSATTCSPSSRSTCGPARPSSSGAAGAPEFLPPSPPKRGRGGGGEGDFSKARTGKQDEVHPPMSQQCPHCRRVLDFPGQTIQFCCFCGGALTVACPTTDAETTLPPRSGDAVEMPERLGEYR